MSTYPLGNIAFFEQGGHVAAVVNFRTPGEALAVELKQQAIVADTLQMYVFFLAPYRALGAKSTLCT